MIARRTCEVDYDGQRITLTVGQTRVVPDHELVRRFPDLWDPEPNDRRTASSNGHGVQRSTLGGGPPARQMTAQEQGRIRRARLDELAARQHERPEPPDPEALFWEGVDRLLGFDRLERDEAEAKAFLDGFEASKARDVNAENETLASWLDR